MSAICHGFVHNAWRKDICSNCFRVRDEHPPMEIHKSVICNGTTVNNSADNNNGVNIFSNGAIIKSSNETLDIFGSSETLGKNQSSQKFNRFHTVTSSTSTSSTATSVTSSSPSNFVQGSSCIPRINGSGGASNNNNSATGSVGKFSGTNSVSTTITKGHINSVYGNNSNGTSTLPETNDKVKSTEGTIAKTSPSQTLSSTSNQNQPQLQGKGMMTNQHPSKCDNGSVIPNHNNNKQSMSSSAGSQPATRSACASIASSSTASSSFIASKNIFNNAASSAISTTTTTTFSTTGLAACVNVNGSVVTSAAATASGSTGLSHPQSATSNKRGSIINNVGLSQPSSTLQKSGVIDVASHNNCVVAVAVPGASHRNLENPNKNGLIESKEFSDGVSNIINISSGVTSGVMSSNKGAITQSGMSRGARAVKQMDVTDGEIERRKVGFPSASGAGNSGDSNVNVSKGKIGGNVKSLAGYKGILRSKTASRKRDRNVRFPDEVVVVIGYGGGPSGSSDDEDDSPPDPLDSASVAEVMEKNSLTFEDKELHRMTQKNTNFNSIKTNLLGTTCIEIGPIVGCTGGKSMEGSSKPLVSIGTFETRKEPLRIHKKISEDSADDELNEKTVEKHRKFIQRTNNSSTSTIGGKASSSQVPSKIASMPSSSNNTNQSSSSKELEIKQQTTTLSTSSSSSSVATKSILSTNNKATSSSSTFNSSTATTLNKMSVSSNKTSSSVSNKSASTLQTVDKGNGSSTNSTTTIEVNPEQTSSCDTTTNNAMRSSKECIAAISSLDSRGKSSSSSSSTLSSHITTSSSTSTATSTLNKWGSSNNPSSTPLNNDGNPTLRNKPVLKRIQKANQSESSSISEQYTVNSAVVETISSNHSSSVGSVTKNTASLNSRNNLIILTSGDKAKVNGNNNSSTIHNGSASTTSLASKRTSFLRDIIVDSSSKSSTVGTTGGIKLDETSGSTTAGVQVICKNNEEQGSLMKKTELKVDLKPSVNNGKLSHPPFGECLSNRSNGTSDSSEFDDSLEDSGLDIKKCSEISESDEKSGSGSDSGNENDYSDRDRVKIIPTAGPKSGLFISVEEVEGGTKKPEKLSPDSVLFSSASEMSASGSSESIPEALDTVSNGSSQKSSSGESGTGATSAAAAIKRAAPRPPQNNSTVESRANSNAIYANTQTNVMQVEGLYDDVSFYKNPMHFPSKGDKISAFEEEDEEEEENIYDDCTTITAIPKGGIKPGSKSAIGSYNFQNGSRSALDSDGDEEAEKVVHRRSDGIEFIGIRKIDSESFLRERSPTPERSPDGKRERSSSASPKTRRKVNQFFSTIGKKAGAAFSQHVHGYGKNKGSPPVDDSIEKSPSGNSSAYKRSLSTDEVSMTRTQEIYATLTPTSLKFKGLAPVLHKLSKMDLHMGDKDNKGYGDGDDDRGDSKEKGYKKHKISSSIKKFLRFGSKDGGESSGHKYDFGSGQNKTEMNGPMISSQITEEQTDSSPSRTPTPTTALPLTTNQQVKVPERKPSCGTLSGRPPPPPPPRVHSLDLLNRVGVVGPNGTVRPARPPPPARHNRVAPSFTSVFTNPNAETETKPNVVTNNDGTSSHPSSNANNNGNGYSHHYNTPNGDAPDPNNPPSKPKRKASMNLECVTSGISRQQDLETTYNHITTLNLETLKLIASQTPTKIRRSNTFSKRNSSSHPLKWSQFHVPESSKPLIHGHGFVFYSAFLDDESCVLLVQESATAPNFSAPFEFPCVETSATFEDFIPSCYVTWQASEYVTNGSNVKVFVSVMPKYNMYTVENYMRHSQVPLLHKYFALLQAMNYWDKEEMSDLLVLVQSMEESDSHFLTNSNTRGGTCDIFHQPSSSPSSVLVYVHPVPSLSKSNGAAKRTSSRTQLYTDFENSMKQILLNNGSDGSRALLGDNDRHVLLKRLNENKAKTFQEQFRLFLQVKLFAPKRDSGELEQIKKLKSERAIQQWLDRERALCMKEAVEQTLQRNIESSISPYKRSYLEFLLTPENSAKAVLDMLIDLLE